MEAVEELARSGFFVAVVVGAAMGQLKENLSIFVAF